VLLDAAQNTVHIFTLCDGQLVLCAGLLILNFRCVFGMIQLESATNWSKLNDIPTCKKVVPGSENHNNTRVGTLIVATIYLQLIQNGYMFRSFTVLQYSHQHCVQPVASDVEVVGYL